jgi:hypothetical protein
MKGRTLFRWKFLSCSDLMFVCSEESENSAPLEVPEMFPSLSLWQKKLCFVESGKQRSLGVCGELSKHDCPSLALVFFAMAMATTARSAARLLRMKASSVQRSSRTFASGISLPPSEVLL